jgi:hypothetical protein
VFLLSLWFAVNDLGLWKGKGKRGKGEGWRGRGVGGWKGRLEEGGGCWERKA